MRDQQACEKLKLLNSSGFGLVHVYELIKLAPYFSQPMIVAYLERAKEQLFNVKDLLLLALESIGNLSIEEISSIAFACVLFGGSAWTSLPKLFASLDALKIEAVLVSFESLLTAKFSNNLAKWICCSWRYLEPQTLLLLRYLDD